MSDANWLLQKSLYELLSTDPSVLNILDGPRVHDAVPRKADYPLVAFGDGQSRDWSTATERGDEHVVSLRVWSRGGGKRENAEIIAVVRSVLDAADLVVPGHHVVNFQFETADIRRDQGGDIWRGLVRFRAVTEPIAA